MFRRRSAEVQLEAREPTLDWQRYAQGFRVIEQNVEKVVQGKQPEIRLALAALLAEGHILIEDVPGVGKTMLAKAIARSIDCSFRRIQFTPDLLPTDVTGVNVFNQERGDFEFKPGAIFANIVLGDEINRASPKTQSALLECMEERQITVDTETYQLGTPFMVIATQNPIEHEGTYALPEAQVDRFVMKLKVDYPSADEELKMLGLYLDPTAEQVAVRRVLTLDEIHNVATLAAHVHVDEKIGRYVVQLVTATRRPLDFRLPSLVPHISFGASPRATLALAHVAKAHAFIQGRAYVVPEDVKAVAHDVLRHRLVLSYEAAAEQMTPDRIIDQILGAVPVP